MSNKRQHQQQSSNSFKPMISKQINQENVSPEDEPPHLGNNKDVISHQEIKLEAK